MPSDALATYLNDHLAGSVAAVELLDRLIENDTVAEGRKVLTELRAEIAADQQTLSDLLRSVGGRESAVRQLGGWLAEKAGHLKMFFDEPARGGLERLEALEFLVLGIHGKQSLWRALAAAQPNVAPLQAVDFMSLERRAQQQHDQAEALRVESARRVLADA